MSAATRAGTVGRSKQESAEAQLGLWSLAVDRQMGRIVTQTVEGCVEGASFEGASFEGTEGG